MSNTNGDGSQENSQTEAKSPDSVENKKSWRDERREERRRRREERHEWRHEHNPYGSIVWAIILIMVGVVFLLNNLGILPWDIWTNVWRFWPLFLVLIGLQIILGRSRISALLIGLVTLLLCGSVIFFSALISVNGTSPSWNLNWDWLNNLENSLNINLNSNALTKDDVITEDDYQNIQSRDVSVTIGSGSFSLNDSSSVNYFEANSIYFQNYGVPVLESSANNSKLNINFSTKDNTNFNIFTIGKKQYDLTIGKPEIPSDVTVDVASGSGEVNLDSAMVNNLESNVSSGSLKVVLGEDSLPSGDFTLKLSSGSMQVELPSTVGVEVDYTVSSGSLIVRGNSLNRNGIFKSDNFDTASKTVKVVVTISSGSMAIN